MVPSLGYKGQFSAIVVPSIYTQGLIVRGIDRR